jgi:plastocyanin
MTVNKLRTCVVALAALVAAGAVHAAGVSGTIAYKGPVPELKPIKMDADPGCAKKHTTPQASDLLVLGPGQTLGNVLVRVTKGLPAQKHPAPTQAKVLDQKGCRYDPHVMGIMVGQPLKILNSDGLLHNVHALPEVNGSFNQAMPPTVTEAVKTFDKPEPPFKIKCDVHPWMGAYVAVLDHPFYDVTEKDGKFAITGLAAGSYTIEAWHEKLGTQTAAVTVAGDATATSDFTFSPPAKP